MLKVDAIKLIENDAKIMSKMVIYKWLKSGGAFVENCKISKNSIN
jgi:hypothetical protein